WRWGGLYRGSCSVKTFRPRRLVPGTYPAQSRHRFRKNGSNPVANRGLTPIFRAGTNVVVRSKPSLGPFQVYKEQHADQEHEADRRIGAGEIITFGKIVDELAEPAKIDEKFGADNVDKGEDQSKADTHKDGRQCRGK